MCVLLFHPADKGLQGWNNLVKLSSCYPTRKLVHMPISTPLCTQCGHAICYNDFQTLSQSWLSASWFSVQISCYHGYISQFPMVSQMWYSTHSTLTVDCYWIHTNEKWRQTSIILQWGLQWADCDDAMDLVLLRPALMCVWGARPSVDHLNKLTTTSPAKVHLTWFSNSPITAVLSCCTCN